MANVKILGFENLPDTLEAPLSTISTTDAIAQSFQISATLPVLGRKYLPPYPEIVIPKFRFVGVNKTTRTTGGNPVLTLATSGTTSYVSPIGVTAADIYRRLATSRADDYQPTVWRNTYIKYPYVTSINDANGALSRGDYIVADGYGRPVRYYDKRHIVQIGTVTYNTTGATTYSSIYLTDAIYAGITPQNVVVWNATQGEAETVVQSSYVTGAGCWMVDMTYTQVTPTTDTILVFYDYGHSVKDVGGQLVSLDVDYPTTNWLRWVGNNFGAFPAVPLTQRAPITLTTLDGAANGAGTYTPGASLTSNSDNTVYQTTYYPIDPNSPITVYVDGVAETKSSVSGLYSGELSGTHYVIDPISGTITFESGYLSGTSVVTATYWRLDAYSLGTQAWPTGLFGMTDETVAPAGLGPGFPPEFVTHIDGGSSAVGGLFIEIL